MVVYVVNAEVDPAREEEWSDWMRKHHAPEVLKEPGFTEATVYRLDTLPEGWTRYQIHYRVSSREALDEYLSGPSVVRLRGDHAARFGTVVRLSRSILTPIDTIDTMGASTSRRSSGSSSSTGTR